MNTNEYGQSDFRAFVTFGEVDWLFLLKIPWYDPVSWTRALWEDKPLREIYDILKAEYPPEHSLYIAISDQPDFELADVFRPISPEQPTPCWIFSLSPDKPPCPRQGGSPCAPIQELSLRGYYSTLRIHRVDRALDKYLCALDAHHRGEQAFSFPAFLARDVRGGKAAHPELGHIDALVRVSLSSRDLTPLRTRLGESLNWQGCHGVTTLATRISNHDPLALARSMMGLALDDNNVVRTRTLLLHTLGENNFGAEESFLSTRQREGLDGQATPESFHPPTPFEVHPVVRGFDCSLLQQEIERVVARWYEFIGAQVLGDSFSGIKRDDIPIPMVVIQKDGKSPVSMDLPAFSSQSDSSHGPYGRQMKGQGFLSLPLSVVLGSHWKTVARHEAIQSAFSFWLGTQFHFIFRETENENKSQTFDSFCKNVFNQDSASVRAELVGLAKKLHHFISLYLATSFDLYELKKATGQDIDLETYRGYVEQVTPADNSLKTGALQIRFGRRFFGARVLLGVAKALSESRHQTGESCPKEYTRSVDQCLVDALAAEWENAESIVPDSVPLGRFWSTVFRCGLGTPWGCNIFVAMLEAFALEVAWRRAIQVLTAYFVNIPGSFDISKESLERSESERESSTKVLSDRPDIDPRDVLYNDDSFLAEMFPWLRKKPWVCSESDLIQSWPRVPGQTESSSGFLDFVTGFFSMVLRYPRLLEEFQAGSDLQALKEAVVKRRRVKRLDILRAASSFGWIADLAGVAEERAKLLTAEALSVALALAPEEELSRFIDVADTMRELESLREEGVLFPHCSRSCGQKFVRPTENRAPEEWGVVGAEMLTILPRRIPEDQCLNYGNLERLLITLPLEKVFFINGGIGLCPQMRIDGTGPSQGSSGRTQAWELRSLLLVGLERLCLVWTRKRVARVIAALRKLNGQDELVVSFNVSPETLDAEQVPERIWNLFGLGEEVESVISEIDAADNRVCGIVELTEGYMAKAREQDWITALRDRLRSASHIALDDEFGNGTGTVRALRIANAGGGRLHMVKVDHKAVELITKEHRENAAEILDVLQAHAAVFFPGQGSLQERIVVFEGAGDDKWEDANGQQARELAQLGKKKNIYTLLQGFRFPLHECGAECPFR